MKEEGEKAGLKLIIQKTKITTSGPITSWLIDGEEMNLNGHEFEQTLGDSGRQESLACCSPWGCRVRHELVTEQQQNGKRTKVNF